MSIPPGWQNHLLATRAATGEVIERMKRIGANGRSPGNHPLVPLTEGDWSVLETGLARIGDEFTDLVANLAPDQLKNARETQPFSATRYHLSLALMSLEQEVLAAIDPDQPPRRGVLAPKEKDQIRSTLTSMRKEITSLRKFVDSLSEHKPGE